MNDNIYQRSEIILGKENIFKLKNKHIVVCGIGGVGSYTLEALARVGVGKITIIDKDIVDITNINRQIIATLDTIGLKKVEVAKKRVESINSEIEVIAIKQNISQANISDILSAKDIDYIVDCVDNIEAKIAIICESQKRDIKCISCMGMGNKLNPLDIKVDDIYKTKVCPLARVVRKRLKQIGIKHQKVVYSTEEPKKSFEKVNNDNLGSVSFLPSVAGLIIASEVVKDIIK